MNILYTVNSGQFGGAEKYVYDLARGMVEKGHKVYIWCAPGDYSKVLKETGAEVTEKVIPLDICPSYIFKLVKFLKKEKIDVIHTNKLKDTGNGLIAASIAGVKVKISHIHTPFSEWQVSKFTRKVYSLCYSIAAKLLTTKEIALTPSRKRVKIAEGVPENKLEVIANGVSMEEFSIDDHEKDLFRQEIRERYDIPREAFVFGNLGRLSAEKGTDILVEGFAKFFQNAKVNKENAYLIIAGGGVLEKELKQKAVELDVFDNIVFTGRFPDEDKVKLYASFDVFIFPSLAEGFGIVLIEAMAMKLPAIVSDLEVLQEVGGSTVIPFETKNSVDLAQKMYNLYSKRDRIDTLGEEARSRVEDLYTLEKFVQNYEDLYLRLLEGETSR